MTLSAPRQAVPPTGGLDRVAPGYYVDTCGAEYFYLTGLYPNVMKRILENPVLNTPSFIVRVLDELRCALQERYCMELMD